MFRTLTALVARAISARSKPINYFAGGQFNQRRFDQAINSIDRRSMPYSDSKEFLTASEAVTGQRVVVKRWDGWQPGTVEILPEEWAYPDQLVILDNGEAFDWRAHSDYPVRCLPFMEDPLDPLEIEKKRIAVVRDVEQCIAQNVYDPDRFADTFDTPEEMYEQEEARLREQARFESDPGESKPFDVSWTLGDGEAFAVTVNANSPEDAAEKMFSLSNGAGQGPDVERWEALGHRSMSVTDVVSVDGVNYYCDSNGWRLAEEHETAHDSPESLLAATVAQYFDGDEKTAIATAVQAEIRRQRPNRGFDIGM